MKKVLFCVVLLSANFGFGSMYRDSRSMHALVVSHSLQDWIDARPIVQGSRALRRLGKQMVSSFSVWCQCTHALWQQERRSPIRGQGAAQKDEWGKQRTSLIAGREGIRREEEDSPGGGRRQTATTAARLSGSPACCSGASDDQRQARAAPP